MAIIDNYLAAISAAVYGSEMRSAIYGAFNEIGPAVVDAASAIEAFQAAMPPLEEVIAAGDIVDGTITHLEMPVSRIRNHAFRTCSQLTTASFSLCSIIGSYAFMSCYSLAEIYFPTCDEIDTAAFQFCSSLSIADFSDCDYIGPSAFANCAGLETASFSTCNYIGQYAFNMCTSLSTINFPVCDTIGSNVFNGCHALESAYFTWESVPSLGFGAFDLTPMADSSYLGHYGSIYVLPSLVDAFKTATNWSAYADRITAYEE